jgi:hypothetical protein
VENKKSIDTYRRGQREGEKGAPKVPPEKIS